MDFCGLRTTAPGPGQSRGRNAATATLTGTRTRQGLKRLSALLVLACGVMLICTASFAQGTTLSGRVIRVLGPNQVVVEGPGGAQYQVQLRGTESAASGYSGAEERLSSDLLGRHVTVDQISGSANQLQGVIHYGRSDVNREWLNEGLLRYDEDSVDDGSAAAYRAAENEARYGERGIWRPTDEASEPAPAPGPAVEMEPPPGGWQFRPERPRKSTD